MYEGETTAMEEYFATRGFGKPPLLTITDWALRVSQTEEFSVLETKGFFEKVQVNAVASSRDECGPVSVPRVDHISLFQQFKELICRDVLNTYRAPAPILTALGVIVALAALIAVCFGGTADSDNLSSRMGVIFFLTVSCNFVTIVSVNEAVSNRPLFEREYKTGHYSLLAYAPVQVCISMVVVMVYAIAYINLVFWACGLQGSFRVWFGMLYLVGMVSYAAAYWLAAIPEDPHLAHTMSSVVLAPQMLLSGFLVEQDDLPKYIQWASWLVHTVFGFRLALNTELAECSSVSDEEADTIRCVEALEQVTGIFDRMGAQDALETLYSEDSRVNLMQAGTYEGPRDILEYLAFFSPEQNPSSFMWNWCRVSFLLCT